MADRDQEMDSVAREQARVESVHAYGFPEPEDAHEDLGVGAVLAGHVTFARTLSGAQYAAVTIIGTDHQRTVAGTDGVALTAIDRADSTCARVLYASGPEGVYVTGDASRDPELSDSPSVSGDQRAVRFYAGAALVGREGLPLGMLCVWSTEPWSRLDAARAAHRLLPVRDSVIEVLEARRAALEAQTPGHPEPDDRVAGADDDLDDTADLDDPADLDEVDESVGLASTPRAGPIDVVIDGGEVQTLFQPIVHIATGSVVAFEALTRGPSGTEFESPVALLEAAREAGRLGELDWLCRARAMQIAAASGLPAELAWFINVEPAGLEIDCPEHLRPALEVGRTGLRVVLEVVERNVEDHITRLLHAADQARRDAWGVALDDVGAATASLALLPFLQPDVVKLDMSLLHSASPATAADVTAAVRSYAEHTGAVILAEGIETSAHEELALVFGATYGQGHRYGHPAVLPGTLGVPVHPIPLRQRPAPLHGVTPFEALGETIIPQQTRPEHLDHIITHLRRYCTRDDVGAVLLALLGEQDGALSMRPLIDAVARHNAFTVCLVPGAQLAQHSPRYFLGPVPEDSRLEQESAMIVLTPHWADALLTRAAGKTAADGTPLVDYIYTHERGAVITAARAYLGQLTPDPHAYPTTPASTDNARTEQNRLTRRPAPRQGLNLPRWRSSWGPSSRRAD